MIRPWIEWNPAYDEYADCLGAKGCWGLFNSGGFCYAGIEWRRSHRADGLYWRLGLIVWNIGFGLWFDEEDE